MQLTQENLKERKTGIGGSDCAAALGQSKWSTPLDVYLDKIDPDSKQLEENDAMRWGNILEPAVIKNYEDVAGVKVEQPNRIFRSEKYPWMLANVDGIVNDNLLLEAKTTKFYSDEWGDEGTDFIPVQYLCQVAHYCIVLDKVAADIAVLGATSDFRIYHYERNKHLDEQIIDGLHDFWHNNVLKQIPPDPVNSSDIIKLYRHADETKILIADEPLSKLAYDHKHVKNQMSELKSRQDFLEMEIKAAMKDHAFLVDLDGAQLISWKDQVANKFQQKDFKVKHQALYDQFCKATESRVLRNKIK